MFDNVCSQNKMTILLITIASVKCIVRLLQKQHSDWLIIDVGREAGKEREGVTGTSGLPTKAVNHHELMSA